MKQKTFLFYFTLMLPYYIVHAQVITDGSIGNPIKSEFVANEHIITVPQSSGATAGNNLFHSFKTFDINRGETVIFTGADTLKNVISRVTGGEPSHINGLLKSAIPYANFYFINPAGVFFDKYGLVDVPAAFHISTGDDLSFKNGQHFSAILSTSSQLSIAEPSEFGFLSNHIGDIHIQTNSKFDIDIGYYKGNYLFFSQNNEVSFNANNIIVDSGTVANPSGSLTLNAQENILLSNKSYIDTSTHNEKHGGVIHVSAKNISLNHSEFYSKSISTGDAGKIIIDSHILNIEGGEISNSTFNKGNAGEITINSDNITITDWGEISSATWNKGNAGIVTINHAKELLLDKGYIYSSALIDDSKSDAKGNAGTVTINSDKITVKGDGEISSSTKGAGHAGTVTINQVNQLILDNGHIDSIAKKDSTGDAGIVNVQGNQLTLLNGGKINTSTYSHGRAGEVNVQADIINIIGHNIVDNNSQTNSQISAAATDNSSGHVGSVNVTAQTININNGGEISILNESNTTTNTRNFENSSGQLNISSANIMLEDGGIITAKSTHNIDAGKINIAFTERLSLDDKNSTITTQAVNGNGGNIDIQGGKLINLEDNAHINTYTEHGVKGGDIAINADILLMDDAQIRAQADKATNGGSVDLTLKAIIPSQNQLEVVGRAITGSELNSFSFNKIQAASSGIVTLNAPQLNLTSSVSILNRNTLELPDLNKDDCDNNGTRHSTLVRASKGGVSTSESDFVFAPLPTTQQFQSAINRYLLTSSLINHYPCAPLIKN